MARKGRVEHPAARLVAAGVGEGGVAAAAAGVAVAVSARLAARAHPLRRPLKEDAGSNAEWRCGTDSMVYATHLSSLTVLSSVGLHAPIRWGHL